MGQNVLFSKDYCCKVFKKLILSAPGLARAGSLGGAGFGLAPCFYCSGCVKGFGSLIEGIPRGLKPRLLHALNAQDKAWAYPRSKCKVEGLGYLAHPPRSKYKGEGVGDNNGANGVGAVPDKGYVDELTQEFIAESLEGLDRMDRCLTDLEVRPHDGGLVAEIFRAVHTIKGTTGFLGFGRLEKLAHAGENLLGALRDGTVAVDKELISGLLSLMDGLRHILKLIEDTGGEGARTTDDDAALIAMLVELKSGSVSAGAKVVPEVKPAAQSGVSVAVAESAINDKSLRIGVEVLNRMMNLVGDLVLVRNQLLQSDTAAANFSELTRRLDSITADLRETVMQARMQPVGHLFSKFPRMVRDLAKTCGREVRIEFSGAETGLDKSLLEAIKDPLTHALRNAVDHGIETPAERLIAGKAAEGCVRLKAFHQSGFVVIEIADDGAGIAMERVLAKAIERELVTADAAAAMTEREIMQLIFLPGFSTAAAVTHVSGRGVGMDVVRANVEAVGGSVEIESQLGIGTTLRLRVPLTLAIVPALVVRSGGQSFALPQSSLAELVYVPEREIATAVERIGAAEFYRLRDKLLPMVWLDRLLELAPSVRVEAQGFYMAVLQAEGRRYGLVVEELLAPEEIVVKPLSAVLQEIGLFSGATVLGNGSLALILDVAETAERAGVRAIEEGVKKIEVAPIDSGHAGGSGTKVLLVVIEDREGERKALPLDMVERIESVPLEQIEHACGRVMLQYRGELLPLDDEGDVLPELRGKNRNADVMATVLICGERRASGVRRRGRVVRQVLDVTAGTWLESGGFAGDGLNNAELALVNERVTTVCGGGLRGGLREVA
jgi:two-component system, chemotaxis family, sensor kinase CheA